MIPIVVVVLAIAFPPMLGAASLRSREAGHHDEARLELPPYLQGVAPLLPGSVLGETGPRGTRLSIACVPLLTTGDERLEERFVREFVAIQIVAVGVIL